MPTPTASTRRRGKRGGRRHRGKETASKTAEGRHHKRIGALCKRIAALRLDHDKPSRPGMADASTESPSAAPTKLTSFDIDRPHWAPQFLPNSMATATIPARTALTTGERRPLNESQPCQIKAHSSQPGSSGPKVERKNSHLFSISAFLACPDPSGRYPSQSKFSEAKCIQKDRQRSEFSVPSTPSSHVQNAATTAAYRALALKSVQTVAIPSTHDSDIQQEKPALLPPLVRTSRTTCPVSLDPPTKANMPPITSTAPWIHLARTATSAEHETTNRYVQVPPLASGFGREPPFLYNALLNKGHAHMIVNPRFHARWQRPSVVVASDEPLMYSDLSRQPRKRSRFFVDGKLIMHDSNLVVQQPAAKVPIRIDNDSTTDTDALNPTTPGSSSHSPFRDPCDRLEVEHAWNTYFAPGARSTRFATADVSSLGTATLSNVNDSDDLSQRMSPVQDHRKLISNTVCSLGTDVGESIPDSDAAGYEIVSPVYSSDSWEELHTPPQPNLDVEPLNEHEDDEDDNESYYESY